MQHQAARRRIVPLAIAFLLLLPSAAFAGAGASIEQVRNGQATATVTPIPNWGTGNAGASNSHYLESHSTAYRAVMTGLPTDGTVVEIVIGYDVKRSGSYALDYLTHYQRLLPHVTFGHRNPEVFDPLAGVSGVGPVVTTALIPVPTRNLSVDPDGVGPEFPAAQPTVSAASLPDSERAMTLFGGNLINVSYDTEADVALATSSSESRVRVRFTPTSPTAVLAWGGHIACRWDWGFNADGTPRSAGGISGSSYHMRLVGWSLGSLGSQDRSMSTDAVYPVPRCAVSNLGPFCAGTTNTHAAPAGMESYKWTLFDNTAGATIVGSDTSTSVTVATTTAGSYSIMVTTGASGFTKQCQATVIVNPKTVADAGPEPGSVCETSPQVQLAGTVSGGTGAWTGGAGTFNPGRSALNATYTPTAAEIAAGGVTLTVTSSGPCANTTDPVRITITPAVITNAGADQVVCAASPLVQLAGLVSSGVSTGTWSGGAGTFTPGPNALNATYLPSADEIAAGSLVLTLTSADPAGPCDAVADAMKITINPIATADAGADQIVCATSPQVTLAGTVGGAATIGTWSGGTGTYAPNASAMGAVYTPSAAEIAAGGVTLTLTTNDPAGPCGVARAQMHVTITPAVTTNAGADQVVCAASPLVQLAGLVSGGATTGTWGGGAGTFTPGPNVLNATYLPSAAEIAAGSVTLTLTSADPAGPCGAIADAMKITINPVATADAGTDPIVCASSPQVTLAGLVGGAATSGTWSGGSGTYNPNASALTAVYTPSAGEIAAGGVTLTLTTNDPAGVCGAVSDAVRITINPVAVANAGLDPVVCASNPQVQLAGSVSGAASGGTWNGGAGTFAPGRASLNATYTPSAAEIAAGTVTLTLVTNDPSGPCPAVNDAVTITIQPAATANAGADQLVCASSPQVKLQGTIGGGASSGTWTGGAGTYSPNAATLDATYFPSSAEIAAGGVTLTLVSNDPAGPCGAVSDAMRISIDPVTRVDAGPDPIVCSSSPQVTLHGTVTGAVTTGSWFGGTGTFAPGRNTLDVVYTPSASEIAAGTVMLILQSTPSSRPCPGASDVVNVWINRAVTVAAGPDQIVCQIAPQVQLAGSIGNGATGATWSGGSGTYNPGPTTLNALYMPSAAEIAAGKVTLTLTTNDPAGPCPPVSDAMTLTIDSPLVTVPTKVTCNDMGPATLCASPSKGVAPYTYLWSNGATSQCITVADTARYTVTVTDAQGCSASGAGFYRWRDCVGMIAHTNTTCGSFLDGTGSPILPGDVSWGVRDGVISNIAPGVFFYFTKVRAPSTAFTINIQQLKDNPVFPFCPVQQGTQVTLYDANCNTIAGGVETSPGQATVNVTNAQVGQIFIVSVKYSLKELIGTPMPDSTGCRYDFQTEVNGLIVDRDPDGLVIGTPKPAAPSTAANGGGGIDGGPRPKGGMGSFSMMDATVNGSLALYRPMPNPFSDGMRMAYAVGGSGEDVSIRVYDVAGRMVRTLVTGFQSAGNHVVAWDGHDEQGAPCHRGVYFVHARIGGEARLVRVTFLK